MDAYRDGCRQFVILAAGLDARAWRLPLDAAVVFEIDVAQAMRYKEAKINSAEFRAIYATPTCRRVTLAADLSSDTWLEGLKEEGFVKEEKSFFIMEGLSMYLPADGACERLVRSVGEAMSCSGSVLIGDVFVNLLTGPWKESIELQAGVLKKYGTQWTFDVGKVDEIGVVMRRSGLQLVEVPITPQDAFDQIVGFGGGEGDGVIDEERAVQGAASVRCALSSIPVWPKGALLWLKAKVAGDKVLGAVKLMCKDATNHHGLNGASESTKNRVFEIVTEGGVQFIPDQLLAEEDDEKEEEGQQELAAGYFIYVAARR